MNAAPKTSHTPVPFLLPALALWGWQADLLPWALAMGLLLELTRVAHARVEIAQTDFNRLWNFTTLLFLGVGLYVFLAREGLDSVGDMFNRDSPAGRLDGMRQVSQTAVAFLLWLPFIFFPFVLAHAWSRSDTLPWSTFSLYEQARAKRAPDADPPEWSTRRVHPGYPYLVLVLFASCAATRHPQAFLPVFLGVILLALYPWRNRRYGAPSWAVMLSLLAVVTLMAQSAVTTLRSAWMAMENRIMQGLSGGGFDPMRSSTALGVVGRLKQSGSIVLRIQSLDGQAPGLMREAAYNRFRANVWASGHREFRPVASSGEGAYWRLAQGRSPHFLTVSRYTSAGSTPLALPSRPLSLRNLPPSLVETNLMAAARLEEAPNLVSYTVEYGEGVGFDGAPESDDTNLVHLVGTDRVVIEEMGQRLGLPGQTPSQAVATVREFFARDFEYSLWQSSHPHSTNATPLAMFLRETRKGHCEFFATATALLLRTAGVPTRYAVGFSPTKRRGNEFLARGRDAHAWCLAHVDGQWIVVDTTPGTWRDHEEAAAGWWEGISDLFSNLRYEFVKWRQDGGNWRILVFMAGVFVLAWMAWRQMRGSRWRAARRAAAQEAERPASPGMDSEFFEVVRRFEATHGERLIHETPRAWIRRMHLAEADQRDVLAEALRLHNRLRFDPLGLDRDERRKLRDLAESLTAPNGSSRHS